MLNLLTDFNLCLLARVPTALAVPVLELDLVFERTLRADHLYACRQRKREWIGMQKENYRNSRPDGRRKRRRECAVTGKAAEAADKAEAHRRHQRERAATRKAIETTD